MNDESWIAIAKAAGGGLLASLGLAKLWSAWKLRTLEKQEKLAIQGLSEAAQIRKELRERVQYLEDKIDSNARACEERIEKLTQERERTQETCDQHIDELREKNFQLIAQCTQFANDLIVLKRRMDERGK